ncbi:similar to Saccharomyces cerevisiae YPL011C TAF3 TFIID subunit (47 kDa), involved in promoter binding and RNA polymerase II transcription initiation [Maudiozyma saulgeensis]|uniref:Similar to Saccharomyces cerevisiae YPL011C TAF3 TFIID subunit (47 kDa), involved in promoter binding and RNA polymerase II transcription initiation n=1 Tax=Maudiozyma saulgeensis TaxID=1789683 RepID=A0A1X7R1I8_9SACH|nr:similar to Saccharomyces cerevisiae YPL011C TAF3 TFIID subunit (47 kDa), involved in promoter binding and RNA polymerase II transcription initiation [Kazachstania saulgeensis]
MTTSNNDFYFGLLRISVIQMLKAQGFDRSKSSTVDTLSDLYIKFLRLLVLEVTKLAHARADVDDTIALQDISQAFTNLGLIKPNDLLDVYDENPEAPGDSGARALKKWCLNSIQLSNSRKVALPNIDMLRMLNENPKINQQPTTTTTSNSKTSTNQLVNENNSSASATTDGLLPINHTQPQKQIFAIPDYMNPAQQNQQEELEKEKEEENNLIEELINNGDTDDWIRLLIVRQKLKIYNRRRKIETENSTSTTHTHSSKVANTDIPVIPDIKSLPNIAGLKYSILYNTLLSNSPEISRGSSLEGELKSHNEILPIIEERDIASPDNISTSVAVDTDHGPISDDAASIMQRVSLLTKLLPIMKPDTKLDNISLSYENSDFDNVDQDNNHASEKGNDDISTFEHEDDNMDGDNNMQLGSTTNNINFDEFGDMDNTFQRRASLDYGSSSIF